MEFTRKRKKGQSQKVCRYWFSEEGYRIVWRKEVCGVHVPARFQAAVRTIIPNYGGEEGKSFEMWDCVSKPRLYKTLKAAQEDCEMHKRLWAKACEATGIRGIIEIFGKLPLGIPVWAKKKLPTRVYEILTRPRSGKRHEHEDSEASPTDPTTPLACSASPASLTPVSPAFESERLTSGTTNTDSSGAKPAKARKKPATKPAVGRKRSARGTPDTAQKPSRAMPKKKPSRSKS